MPASPSIESARAEPGPLAIALATTGFYLSLVLGSFFWGWLAVFLGAIPPRGNLTFWVARQWGRTIMFFSGVRLEVHETPRMAGVRASLKGSGSASEEDWPVIYLANHQSIFDIPAVLASLQGQGRFMAKRSLFRIPIFGWALAIGGFVPVDRGDRGRGKETLLTAEKRLAAGASMIIFPEATRSRYGKLLGFKRGGFRLADQTGRPIVPIGLRGTYRIRPVRSFLVRPGVAHVHFGDPIPAEPPDRDFVERVRGEVAALAGQTIQEVQNPEAP